MLQRYESVIFGGKHDQTAPAILFQILIHLQPQEAKKKKFLLLMPSPSVFLQLHQKESQQHRQLCFLSMLSYFVKLGLRVWSQFWSCWSFVWVGNLFCIIHRNYPFVFICRTARGMDLMLVWIVYNYSLVSCIHAGFCFLLPTVVFSTLEDNPAANLLWHKDSFNLVPEVVQMFNLLVNTVHFEVT